MRDDFSQSVKRTLAFRVASCCSNPNCRVRTSGPSLDPAGYINVGVAAHIAAASRGGPRYDEGQSLAARSAAANGIWLCQTCAKLVDSDEVQYTVKLLQQWKHDAESAAQPGSDDWPAGDDADDDLVVLGAAEERGLLAYANLTIEHIGRERELDVLHQFLVDPAAFRWWLWTGPAGMGKSRLALELCRRVPANWDAGFLDEISQDRILDRPFAKPTLIVVDYAAQRGPWLSDALLRLSRRNVGKPPVRMLILERQAEGDWWDTVQRCYRYTESREIASTSYAYYKNLTGLNDDETTHVIEGVAASLGRAVSNADVEDIVNHAKAIDGRGRPLLAIIAALDWLEGPGLPESRDHVLKEILIRTEVQLLHTIGTPSVARKAKNLLCYSTAVGGFTFGAFVRERGSDELLSRLLPEPFSDLGTISPATLLTGMEPDLLGELFVLERLNREEPEPAATKELLQAAWRAHPEAYCAFVERAAADHQEHPRLNDLLDQDLAPTSDKERWAELAASVLTHVRRSDHPAILYVLQRLSQLTETHCTDKVRIALATAHLRVGNIALLRNNDPRRAIDSFSFALSIAEPEWTVRANILNNRGIAYLELGNTAEGCGDYTTVIEAAWASDEARACSLNNRADVYDRENQPELAIADRSAVIALKETTYNRRFIAHHRRSGTLWKIGQKEAALADIEAILATSDIAMEQKMFALLLKARFLNELGDSDGAVECVTTVLASHRNFDEVASAARDLDRELRGARLSAP